ncbi:hypothetical protein [Sphingobium sp. CFD-2]|uniref:hypothetical protein n=1 Tax=Sphingobium sp. CFD-2 TaxID=2878542 RepID=UPI00214BDD77|nr:hypothetical protein [Sphingobium sp. CFD-2]
MIFQDGEFRPTGKREPMLFDGWDYVPVAQMRDAQAPGLASAEGTAGTYNAATSVQDDPNPRI